EGGRGGVRRSAQEPLADGDGGGRSGRHARLLREGRQHAERQRGGGGGEGAIRGAVQAADQGVPGWLGEGRTRASPPEAGGCGSGGGRRALAGGREADRRDRSVGRSLRERRKGRGGGRRGPPHEDRFELI